MSEALPHPQRPPIVRDILVDTHRGPEVWTFNSHETVVRTFGPRWCGYNYVAQPPVDDQHDIRILFGFPRIGEYLIGQGFHEFHTDEPTDGDKELFVTYGVHRMEHELNLEVGE